MKILDDDVVRVMFMFHLLSLTRWLTCWFSGLSFYPFPEDLTRTYPLRVPLIFQWIHHRCPGYTAYTASTSSDYLVNTPWRPRCWFTPAENFAMLDFDVAQTDGTFEIPFVYES